MLNEGLGAEGRGLMTTVSRTFGYAGSGLNKLVAVPRILWHRSRLPIAVRSDRCHEPRRGVWINRSPGSRTLLSGGRETRANRSTSTWFARAIASDWRPNSKGRRPGGFESQVMMGASAPSEGVPTGSRFDSVRSTSVPHGTSMRRLREPCGRIWLRTRRCTTNRRASCGLRANFQA